MPARARRTEYRPEAAAAAKLVRGVLPNMAPGPKQVAKVAAVVGDQPIAKAAGLSKAKLRAWAKDGERPADSAEMRPLARRVDDRFATGRRLAAILWALDEVAAGGGG